MGRVGGIRVESGLAGGGIGKGDGGCGSDQVGGTSGVGRRGCVG